MSEHVLSSLLDAHGDDTLAHAYASKYYDPQKAHEYYERTKVLTGRKPATTKNQAVGLKYANNQISNAQKAELEKLKTKREATLADIQKRSKETAERIQARLKETIAAKADAILKRLENLPEDTDPKIIARLMQGHSKNVVKARQQSQKAAQQAADGFRKAFKKARDEYTTNRNAITKRYTSTQKTEEKNIRAYVR